MNSQYETLKIDKTYKPQGVYPLINGPCKSCPKGTDSFSDTETNSVKCKGCNQVLVSGSTTLSPNIDSQIFNYLGKDKAVSFFNTQSYFIKNFIAPNEPILFPCVNCSKRVTGIHDVDTNSIKCKDCNKVISMAVTMN